MGFVLRVWAVFIISIKRLYAQKGLTLATLLGLIMTVALTLSVPLYADAVYFRVLQEELSEGSLTLVKANSRSPFTFMFRYIGAWNEPIDLEDLQPVDAYLSGPVQRQISLPSEFLVRYFKTENFRLFPSGQASYSDNTDPLDWVNFGFITGIEDKITLLEGQFPAVAASSPDSTVEILMSESLATELGVQVGETFMTFIKQDIEGITRSTQIPVRVSGIWRPQDDTDSYWFYTPATLEELFIVPEETFLNRISPYMEEEIGLALWYHVLDGSQVTADDAGSLLARINAAQQQTSALLPGTSLDLSPADALQRYRQASTILTVLLYAFSIPILALILTFISLVVNLTVSRQRNEIAVLRSRGATTLQVVSISALEAVLMGILALAIGLPLGELLAQLIGQTQSFLNFSNETDLRVNVTTATLRFGMIAIGLALAAQIVPTFTAARHTIVSYKQTQARSMRPPLWQRMWLDVLLLIPAVYGTYLLQQQESIVLIEDNSFVSSATPFQNPLLLLVPALGILALTLLFLRLLPYIMRILAWLFSYIGGIGLLLATRQLARTPGFYTAPMLLLVLTLSLSTFTASLAQTLDNHLYDQMYYKIGADMSMADLGQGEESSNPFGAPAGGDGGSELASLTGVAEDTGPRWFFLPVTEYLNATGVEAAARVGGYGASTRLSGGRQSGTFLGVDRVDFPQVAYWRFDFAPSYLAELMNALAITPDGVLMPREFMSQHALRVGDTVQVSISVYGQTVELPLQVMGGFDYFPTWYPEDGPLFVGNLDYFFQQAGGQYPYRVWLRTQPNADYNLIMEEVRDMRLKVLETDPPLIRVFEEQQNPQRQGLFGLLSVGFGAAALFTVLGFLLYALFSFRQRFIELGVLRAVGLSSGQMTVFLAWELAFLILTGLFLGTFLGILASELYIPYLQVGVDAVSRTPPFLVEIAWPAITRIYALFGLLFIIALVILGTLLLRMKIFQAVKLGETV